MVSRWWILVAALALASVPVACGAESDRPAAQASAGSSASPAAGSARLQEFLELQGRALDLNAAAGGLERKGNGIMLGGIADDASFDEALRSFHEAAQGYRKAADLMASADAPHDLSSFDDVAAAQTVYADTLDRWTETPVPEGLAEDLDAAWLRYRAAVRRYNEALFQVSERAGVRADLWLFTPPMGQP